MKSAIAVLILLGLIWVWSGDHLPFQSEVTVYTAFCPTERVDGKCPAGEEPANPTTYRADAGQQTVITWTGDGAPTSFA